MFSPPEMTGVGGNFCQHTSLDEEESGRLTDILSSIENSNLSTRMPDSQITSHEPTIFEDLLRSRLILVIAQHSQVPSKRNLTELLSITADLLRRLISVLAPIAIKVVRTLKDARLIGRQESVALAGHQARALVYAKGLPGGIRVALHERAVRLRQAI